MERNTSLLTERLEREQEDHANSINNFLTRFLVAKTKICPTNVQITSQEVESNIEENKCQRVGEVSRIDKDVLGLQKSLEATRGNIMESIDETRRTLLETTSQSCQSVRDYCQENIIDINNNIVDFKDAVRESNVKINKKILGCGKNLEKSRPEINQ